MKVLVLTNMAPFVRGGAEELADFLVAELGRTPGVRAELLRLPFRWDPAERLLEEMLIARSLRLDGVDRVIALKFPAYLVPHDRKVVWLLHQYRQAYEQFGGPLSNIPDTPRGREIRDAIRAADDHSLRRTQSIFTIAANPGARLLQFNRLESEVLPLPLNDPDLFQDRGPGDYLFAGGRINAAKRQHLLIEAMRLVGSPARLVVAGPPESEETAEELRRMVRELDLGSRVTLEFGYLPRARIADYVNHALACAYLPVDEDAPGYVTMEAFHASKAILTVADAGGVLELVRNGETGWVAEPTAASLAAAIDGIFRSRRRTRAMGAAARAALLARGATWPATVEKLLS